MDWKWNGTLEMVDPRLIVVDHRYQRPPHANLIAAIAANPTPEAFAVLVCFRRDNGVYYCADGQQRLAGVLASEDPPLLVPVVWFPVNGVAHEAEIFVRINDYRKALSPLQKHTGKVTAEEPAALAINRAVTLAGFSIGHTPSGRSIGAVAALNYAHDTLGEDGVTQLLVLVREAWPEERKALDTILLRVLSDIIKEQRDNGGYARSKTVGALKRTVPSAIFRKAEEIHFEQGTSKRESIRKAIKVLTKL